MKDLSEGSWTPDGWMPTPKDELAAKRLEDRMHSANKLAHKAMNDLTRQLIGLASDGAESPTEMCSHRSW